MVISSRIQETLTKKKSSSRIQNHTVLCSEANLLNFKSLVRSLLLMYIVLFFSSSLGFCFFLFVECSHGMFFHPLLSCVTFIPPLRLGSVTLLSSNLSLISPLVFYVYYTFKKISGKGQALGLAVKLLVKMLSGSMSRFCS